MFDIFAKLLSYVMAPSSSTTTPISLLPCRDLP